MDLSNLITNKKEELVKLYIEKLNSILLNLNIELNKIPNHLNINSKKLNRLNKKEIINLYNELINLYNINFNNIETKSDINNMVSDNIIDTNNDLGIKYNISLYNGDCLIKLDIVQDKSIQLICIDPPYNINKDEWDNIPNYNIFMLDVIKKLEMKLRDNGSLFIFHNNMEKISELMIEIKNNTKFVFRQMIVWNKRFNESAKKGFLDGYVVKNDMHNWNKMCEYILFYTFDNSYKLLEARKKYNVTQITISKEIKSKTGGITGWYSNLETGKNLPTLDTIKPIQKHLNLNYEDIVPKFYNKKTHHSVWNYDMAPRNNIHITPKPIDLLINILEHTTDINDLVLDCFAGSGSMGMACQKLNRRCILIEKDSRYCKYISDTLQIPIINN